MIPDKNKIIPNSNIPNICYIKNIIKNPNITVGDYTYYEDKNNPQDFEKHITHFYDFIGDKLIIGKFCQIASGIEIVMNGANHKMSSATSYPFNIFGEDWQKAKSLKDTPYKGDTVIGNDVWIGQNVTILPGVHIGDGAIIGANSVVAKDIPPYTIAVGNPCEVKKKRFSDDTIKHLLEIKWWNWDIEKITKNLDALTSNNIDLIKKIK
ncbi:MAG: Vat family streptogramin A O-acetyltransferase [Clostridia bacterium]|nr:Vat family streptogramin A O-acetyltransferase [Clostridia bacterium]